MSNYVYRGVFKILRTVRRPVRPTVDDDLEIYSKRRMIRDLTGWRPVRAAVDNDFAIDVWLKDFAKEKLTI